MPLPYGFIDERDILWSKATWEIIDLDERVNFPLYYPIVTNNIGQIDVLYTMFLLLTLKMVIKRCLF